MKVQLISNKWTNPYPLFNVKKVTIKYDGVIEYEITSTSGMKGGEPCNSITVNPKEISLDKFIEEYDLDDCAFIKFFSKSAKTIDVEFSNPAS